MSEIIIPYRPRPWARELHNNSKRFKVAICHRAAGKSIFAINSLIRDACTGPPDAVYLYVLPQQNQARRNVWDHVKHYCRPIPGVSMQNQSMETRFPNGSKLLLLGSDNPDSLRGLHVHAVVLDEVDDMSMEVWTVIRPTLTTHVGNCTWIGTPKGKQELWRVFQLAQNPKNEDWYGIILPWHKTGVLSVKEVESMRIEMSEAKFAQEMECDFDAPLIGAYYGKLLTELRENGRIAYYERPLYRPDLEVITAWDLGIRDRMSVWMMQRCGDDINVIDYFEESGWGFAEWSSLLDHKANGDGLQLWPARLSA